ncbi:MAG: MraY family glycosyltransferase [Planctomycetota bacterium]
MIGPQLGLFIGGVVASFVVTGIVTRIGRRAGTLDGDGVEGQIKREARRVPNIGGIGIAAGVVAPIVVAAVVVWFAGERAVPADLAGGLRSEAPAGLVLLGGLVVIHLLGLVDDRRPLPWGPKLVAMLAVPAAVAWLGETRVLEALDTYVGGAWLSIGITALWFAAAMNALNFMDNMDGLAGGVAAVIAGAVWGVATLQGQWLVAGLAACVCGAAIGFLPHNFPRARVFMGDGGSLVLGFLLAYLTTRLTYVDSNAAGPRWDRIVIPMVLLAVPLYDLCSVIVLRLRQGRSPFVGDLQHLSHRFEGRGLSRPLVAVSVWALTAVTATGAIIVAIGTPSQSVLVAVQTLAALGLLAAVERRMPWEAEK